MFSGPFFYRKSILRVFVGRYWLKVRSLVVWFLVRGRRRFEGAEISKRTWRRWDLGLGNYGVCNTLRSSRIKARCTCWCNALAMGFLIAAQDKNFGKLHCTEAKCSNIWAFGCRRTISIGIFMDKQQAEKNRRKQTWQIEVRLRPEDLIAFEQLCRVSNFVCQNHSVKWWHSHHRGSVF